MAASSYFSHLTSPDDSDVDAIISEAADLSALQQIAAINTAHLSPADLPPELESRFRQLKSFPGATRRTTLRPHSSGQQNDNPPPSSIQPEKFDEAEPEIYLSTPSPKSQLGEGFGTSSPPGGSRRSPSPTQVICCFGFSPKKTARRRRSAKSGGDEIFVGFGAEKMKEQRRKLEKVLREQEKASMEVEKMVDMFEAAADRLNAEAFEELMVGDVMEMFK
ncbi:hypothetical protein KSP39_PZI022553 [Platanthera zijinensis]|uniref:Uncharacterized protein n=1 Tax=Platanthera zijinensis TaxID=2320716 RepID=A0AAP0FUL8_9ASPA